jgi:hypothetical protein
MSLPQVSLTTGKVSWIPPIANADNSPLTPGEITGYIVGLRSTTAAGSAAGTYPIHSPLTAPDAVTEAIGAITASLQPDTYAVAVQTQSKNGPSVWSVELLFTGTLPVPAAPTGVQVA